MWEENFGIRYLDKQLVHILSVPQVFLFLMQTQIIQIKSSENIAFVQQYLPLYILVS